MIKTRKGMFRIDKGREKERIHDRIKGKFWGCFSNDPHCAFPQYRPILSAVADSSADLVCGAHDVFYCVVREMVVFSYFQFYMHLLL